MLFWLKWFLDSDSVATFYTEWVHQPSGVHTEVIISVIPCDPKNPKPQSPRPELSVNPLSGARHVDLKGGILRSYMGSSLNEGPFLESFFFNRGAVLYWGSKKGTRI